MYLGRPVAGKEALSHGLGFMARQYAYAAAVHV